MNNKSEQIQALIDQISPHALKGDYRTALKIARQGLQKFPDEVLIQYQYAKLLGDWADEKPAQQKRKLKNQSIRILKPLLRRLRGLPPKVQFGISLNYYYQTEKFRQMYTFGRKFLRTNKDMGHYAIGLAAGLLAQLDYDKGKRGDRAWAKKSVKAWESYPLRTEGYYFAHYSFAKALALAGQKKAALKSLMKASRLAERPLTDWEFADVLKVIQEDEWPSPKRR